MTIQQAYASADSENTTITASDAPKRNWHAIKYLQASPQPAASEAPATECPYCHSPLQTNFVFCPFCGKEKEKKSRGRRAPNGQGHIFKRGYTWSIRIRIGPKNMEKGGFSTKREAQDYALVLRKKYEEALAAKENIRLQYVDITFKELYTKMMERDSSRIVKSTLDCYRSAYNYYEDIYELKFADLNTEDFQLCLDDCPRGPRTKENMKALGTKLYKYANELRVFGLNTETDFARFVWIDRTEKGTRNPFTETDLKKLKAAVKNKVPNADIIYAMCATGFRPSEFLSLEHDSYDPELHTLRGGAKTNAGKNRIVPVHPSIIGTVEKAYASGAHLLFNPENHSLSFFRENIFYPCLDAAGIQKITDKPRLTPYSTRHTFSTLMKKIPGSFKDKAALMGHTSFEMTLHYQHDDYESLKNIINQISL